VPKRTDIRKVLIVGAGPIVIGQACEFDYSGVQACKALREAGYEVVLLNSNPATIMTDPETAERTYIEPITLEMLEAILDREKPDALLPTLGGQTALNLAVAAHEAGLLERFGVEMIGATAEVIHRAEDRDAFKETVTAIGVEVLRSELAHDMAEARRIAADLSLPVVIRPSFTLGGSGGSVAYNREEFEALAASALEISPVHAVLLEECVIGWKEFELEVMRDGADNAVIICSIENVGPMGVHTGDSITVAPAQARSDREYQAMRDDALKIIRAVGVATGGCDIQFAVCPATGRRVAIEMNPRVSRSSALASKATGFPIAKIAAKVAVGMTLDEIPNDITRRTPACFEPTIDYCVVKVPRFTFEKFPAGDPTLTVSMKSVGEVMAIDRDFGLAYAKSQIAAGTHLPTSGTAFVSIKDADKPVLLPVVRRLKAMGFALLATDGTAAFLDRHRVENERINKVSQGRPHVVDAIKNARIDLIVNTPSGLRPRADEAAIRINAVAHGTPLITTATAAEAAIAALRAGSLAARPIQDYLAGRW